MRRIAIKPPAKGLGAAFGLPAPAELAVRAERRRAARTAGRTAAALARAGLREGRKTTRRALASCEAAVSTAVTQAWTDGVRTDPLVDAFARDPERLRRTILAAGARRRGAAALGVIDGPSVDALVERLGFDPRAAAAGVSEAERWRGADLAGSDNGEDAAAARRRRAEAVADAIEAEGRACFAAWARARPAPFDALTLALAPEARGRAGAPIEAEARRRAFDAVAAEPSGRLGGTA